MSNRSFKIEGVDDWLGWLERLEEGRVDEMKSKVLRTVAFRGLEVAQDNTPRRSGRLAGSLTVGDKDNMFTLKVGKTSWVSFGTSLAYAAAVNDGYTQKAGSFVPGFWKGDTFHYDPASKGGMVLTGQVIEGARYFEKAVEALESGDVDRIVEFEFKRLYAELG